MLQGFAQVHLHFAHHLQVLQLHYDDTLRDAVREQGEKALREPQRGVSFSGGFR